MVLLVVAVAIAIWLAYAWLAVPWLVREHLPAGADAQGYGLVGDMFGGLNTLFAGLAFAFVAIAAYYQRQTMLGQREELETARQQSALQAFEPLFFQLLEMFRDQHESARLKWAGGLDYALRSPDAEGQIRRIAEEAHLAYAGSDAHSNDEGNREAALSTLASYYIPLYRKNEGTLGPMFRTLYHAIRLIAKSGLDPAAQVRYANIARGLLGGELLLMLMLNCLCAPGHGFKPYVEHFGLLKHIRRDTEDGVDQFVASFFSPTAQMSHVQREEFWKKEYLGLVPKLPD